MSNSQSATLRRASLATLVWTVPVRIVDVSRSGCRLESSRWLSIGTSGHLRLTFEGRTHQDDVRIARCQVREGAGSTYVLGAELLATRRLSDRSIRMAIGQLIGQREQADHLSPGSLGYELPDRESEQLAKGGGRSPPGEEAQTQEAKG